ncbi:hypothetical protein KFL_006310100 [Klebsormidium nitens]|uniref:Uncharacterized protein n=1 Tax=Klebsormidium nitens TaxID=105231 RepID=A0A1Y1IHK7_KLENI|nr:hypothetical protein KFL_006310100 [Klebsormidium nitens]|eukprot:GAQ90360.1 hypothetical protein KFL_006310100 [Klebsormidium nitens]
MDTTTFEDLGDDIVCLILDKTLKPVPPGIASRTLASFACTSSRYASLMKERGWERACRNALPDLCEILLSADKESPGDAGWDCFAKLLTRCPGYRSKLVYLVYVTPYSTSQTLFTNTRGQIKGLETFNVALKSHVSDNWLLESPPTFLSEGEKILPGLIRAKSPFFLLSNCESGPSHVVRSTYTEWKTQGPNRNVWKEVPLVERSPPTQAIVEVYRGLVADVSALASDFAHTTGDAVICEKEPAALDRKAALKTPEAKQCPFCARPMQRISSRFHNWELCSLFGAASAAFDVCSSGHIYVRA